MSEEVYVPKVGRPRKDKSEKVEYQHIAVHAKDYLIFLDKVDESGKKKVEVFHEMVESYNGVKIPVKFKHRIEVKTD